MKNDKDWVIETYPDGRRTLVPPTFEPYLRVAGRWFGGRPPNSQARHEFIPRAEYQKRLRAWYRDTLHHLVVNFGLCRFVTLTLDRDMDWWELMEHFNQFMLAVARAFPKTEYLRAVEVQKGTQRLHIHVILLFTVKVPKQFNLAWVKSNWECGKICHIVKYPVDEGAFQYLCKDKEDSKSEFTRFPRGEKVIARSRKFGQIVLPTKSRIPSEKAEQMIEEQIKLYKDGKGHFVRIDDSWFYDEKMGKVRKRRNRVFFREIKEENNDKPN